MEWESIETAPKGVVVLVGFGTKADGMMGYEIAVNSLGWRDRSGKKIEGDGFYVIKWATLPPLE